MLILLLGSGGREHALAWKLSQSPLCECLYIAPGNAGTAECGINMPIDVNDFEAIGNLVKEEGIELVLVGPEDPLVNGIYDYFQRDEYLRDIVVIGPSAAGAQLEGSKAFAKAFMQEFDIPTAAYREFTQENLAEGLDYLRQHNLPVVLKADGLAAGKGVLICQSSDEAEAEFAAMLDGKFGAASQKVVVEAFLEGIEFSVFAITDGTSYKLLPVAKDYKRVGEGDTGLNTGGMGAVSPPPFVDEALMQKVEERIVRPTIEGIGRRGFPYQGFVFFGLIKVGEDPFVIEYNCRLGDPETEVIMPRMHGDLVELLLALGAGDLAEMQLDEDPQPAATLMLVSGGYPGNYAKGKLISGLEKVEGSMVFHAGTIEQDGAVLTNGGRVLAITSMAEDLPGAIALSNHHANLIQFENKYYRRDIGFDL